MATFLIAFLLLALVILGMSLGVILSGRRIQGSCGGLNGMTDADKCMICNRNVDADHPLQKRAACPRSRTSQAR